MTSPYDPRVPNLETFGRKFINKFTCHINALFTSPYDPRVRNLETFIKKFIGKFACHTIADFTGYRDVALGGSGPVAVVLNRRRAESTDRTKAFR